MENNHLTPIPLAEAARLLAVSSRTVRRLVERGDLVAIRIGATLTLLPEALPGYAHRNADAQALRPLLTIHDVARRLGRSPRQVRGLSAEGLLHPIAVGSSMRWSVEEVEALDRCGNSS